MGLFDVGLSGLTVAQRALATAGHNIVNVNTEGFSRQRVDLVARPPEFRSGGYAGTGVTSAPLRRVVDDFLTAQVRAGTASVGSGETFYNLATQLDELLASQDGGLSPALQSFFESVQGVANDPASIPAREVLLSEAGTLVERFHSLEQRLAGLYASQGARLNDVVNEINSLAKSLVDVNEQIRQSRSGTQDAAANDLLDQRDEVLKRLAEKIDIRVLEQGDGTVNVSVGSGQVLVAGGQALRLSVVPGIFDRSALEIGYSGVGGTGVISQFIRGGELGGLLEARGRLLEPAANALGRVAVALSESFNTEHGKGMDLAGSPGGDFFTDLSAVPATFSNLGNTGNAVITAQVTAASALTTSDYRIEFDGTDYIVRRASDQRVLHTGALPTEVDGVRLSLTSGTPAAGDSFLVQPTRSAARLLAVQVVSTRQIAAAAPIRTAADLANTGTGRIAAGTVADASHADLLDTVRITFSAPGSFDVRNVDDGSDLAAGVVYVPGADLSFQGWTVQITGVPAAGDVFTVSRNSGGVGDNRNALALAGLQTRDLLDGGTATLENAYGQLVARVGAETRQADINLGAQKSLLDQARASRDAVSGVNLDEEAANLLRFQQAYQASAQVISAADRLFQYLIDAVRG